MFDFLGGKTPFLFFVVLLLALSGCSGLQYDPNDTTRWLIQYESFPSGIEVYEGSRLIGITPFVVSVDGLSSPVTERAVRYIHPCGGEYDIKHSNWALKVKVDLNNSKATIREYPTGLSPFAVTNEIDLAKNTIEEKKSTTTLLRCAIFNNDFNEIKNIVKSGQDVNTLSRSGNSPLMYAVLLMNSQAVDILLESGADPDVTSSNGGAPLILAVLSGQINIVKMLLDSEAAPNIRNNKGATPLIFAASKGYIDLVKILLEYGADPTLAQNNGITALDASTNQTISQIIKSAIAGNYARQNPTAQPPKDFVTITGTGWVTAGGYIVTNYHVIEDHNAIAVRFNSIGETEYPAQAIVSDKSNDLAILKLVKSPDISQIPGLPIPSTFPSLGEDVFTLGFPKSSIMGKNPKVTDGIVSALSGIQDDPTVMQITVPIQSGNSGGPLMNMKGDVVGVTTSSLRTQVTERGIDVPQNVNYAVKTAYVNVLLSSLPIDNSYPMVKVTENQLSDIVPQVKNSVVHIIVQAKR